MPKKRYKIRVDRIIAILILIFAPIFPLIVLPKHLKEETPKSSSFEVQTETSAVCTSSTKTAITTSITTEPVTIPIINTPQCSSAAFYSVDDYSYIYKDNIKKRVAPASLTKLLTASVALHYVNKDKVFTVDSEQWLVQPNSSLCYLQIGNTLTLEDLITGMLMASGNDAAYTIAVSVARELNPNTYMTDDEAVDYFCDLMNDFAHNLGMTNSNFVNPDGWDNGEQYTTVEDLIKISEYALSVPEISNIIGTYYKSVTINSGETFSWTNSNLLLDPYSSYYCDFAVGMKTGTTPNAGNNLIAVFEKNKRMYISIVTGCQSDTDRYELTLKLLSLAEWRG